MKKQWKKDLERLGTEYVKTPPEGLLADIKREMLARGIVPAQPKRKISHAVSWPQMAVAASALVLLGVSAIGYLHHYHKSERTMADKVKCEKKKTWDYGTSQNTAANVIPTAINDAGYLLKKNEKKDMAQSLGKMVSRLKFATGKSPSAHTNDEGKTLLAQSDIDHDVVQTPLKHEEDAKIVDQNNASQTLMGNDLPQSQHYRPQYSTNRHNTLRHADTWQLTAYYMGQPHHQSADGADMMYATSMTHFASEPVNGEDNNKSMSAISAPPVKREYHHRPIKIGVSAQYLIDDRWSILSGLTYSKLISTFTEETVVSTKTTEQTLHYIGIPISVTYSLWQSNYFNIYVKAGAEVEKLVKGKSVTKSVDIDRTAPPVSKTLSEHKLLFSAHAAAGMAYKPVKMMSVFVEPGLEYYFKNQSDIKSSYTDKPLGGNVNVGIRLNIK